MNTVHSTRLRVRYGETDQGGVVYHGSYLLYFEVGRTEFLRELGHPYAEMERQGRMFPVVEAHVNYRASARYDDELRVETAIRRVGRVRLGIDTRIIREADECLLCDGWITLACTDLDGRPSAIPDAMRAALADCLAGGD